PSVRNGRIAPYRRSQTRTTSTDNPVNLVTAPIMYFGFAVDAFFPAMTAHFHVSSRFCQDNSPQLLSNHVRFLVIILTRVIVLAMLPLNQPSARRCKNGNTNHWSNRVNRARFVSRSQRRRSHNRRSVSLVAQACGR